MALNFIKMQGCGNDFLIFDCMNDELTEFSIPEIQHLCDRQLGVGADGFVILHNDDISEDADAAWIFYNCDGNKAEMCGNAARCCIRYLVEKYFDTDEPVGIETQVGIIRGKLLEDGTVEVTLIPRRDFSAEVDERILQVGEDMYQLQCVNTGVPHAVLETSNLNAFPIDEVGYAILHHPAFQPAGTNFTLFERRVANQIFATTFERGVEKQTLACGTGAAAAAIVYGEMYMEKFPIQVTVPGGELEVDLSPVTNILLLRGPAEYVFEISIEALDKNFVPVKLFGLNRGGTSK